MSKFLVLLKKEIKELITPQMVVPLIMMVLVFAGIGGLLTKEKAEIGSGKPLWIINQDNSALADELIQNLRQAKFEVVSFERSLDQVLSEAQQNEVNFVLVIPKGFESNFDEFRQPQLQTYNLITSLSLLSSMKNSQNQGAITIINNFLSQKWVQEKNIGISAQTLAQPANTEEHVVINNRKARMPVAAVMGFVQQQTTFIPIILFLVIVVAAQMVAMAVASEKENKTFETLLSSPIGRKTIVFAKLLGAGIVALLFAGFYMVGFNFYIKGLTSQPGQAVGEGIQQALSSLGIQFDLGSYLLLGASLFMGILVALAIAMILGIMADSVKGVQAVTTPLMVLILIPYILVMFLDIQSMSAIARFLIYLIPFSHPFLAAQKIVTHDFAFIVYGIIYQLFIFLIFVYLAAKIFSSDRILTLRFGRKKRQ